MGRYAQAHDHLMEGLAIAREIGDRPMIAAVLQPLGMVASGRSELAAARSYLEEAVALERELGNKRGLASAINGLAQLQRETGALDAAERLYEQVLALARELGDREVIAIVLLNLAMVSIERGSGDRVSPMLLEVLAIAREIGSKPAGQSALEVCAGLGASRAEWARAARFFGVAEAQTGETGICRDPADQAFLAPLMTKARDALGAAGYDEAESAGRALPYATALDEARAWLTASPREGCRNVPEASP
jgi:tetratricopeptide (TPR) repeat protein